MIILRNKKFADPAGSQGSPDQATKAKLGLQNFDNEQNANSFKAAADQELAQINNASK